MGMFSSIKDAIFGRKAKPAPAPTQAQSPQAMPQMNQPQAQAPVNVAPVDVDQVLGDLAAKNGEQLNYKSSIVDLMKLLDLDPSLANRKELAEELGYSGAKDGSAEMNIWLHKAVMTKLEENGGKVSAELRD